MSAHEYERGAHDAILAWCRSDAGKRSVNGHPGMREPGELCVVIDLDRTEPKPGSTWERRPITYASGPTWLDCLVMLKQAGLLK